MTYQEFHDYRLLLLESQISTGCSLDRRTRHLYPFLEVGVPLSGSDLRPGEKSHRVGIQKVKIQNESPLKVVGEEERTRE